jgi:hypothetical protein
MPETTPPKIGIRNVLQNPTGTVGALTYWALAEIKRAYLKQPAALQ